MVSKQVSLLCIVSAILSSASASAVKDVREGSEKLGRRHYDYCYSDSDDSSSDSYCSYESWWSDDICSCDDDSHASCGECYYPDSYCNPELPSLNIINIHSCPPPFPPPPPPPPSSSSSVAPTSSSSSATTSSSGSSSSSSTVEPTTTDTTTVAPTTT